jgi:AcrR family transcriptional regulator
MSDTTYLREKIMSSALTLFMQNGYEATSIKQIAVASGCTTAALYYYFEGGKGAILSEIIGVIHQQRASLLDKIDSHATLEELIAQLGQMVLADLAETLPMLNWLSGEYPHLPQSEQQIIRAVFMDVQNRMTNILKPYCRDEADASTTAWIIVFVFMGYAQIFLRLGLDELISPETTHSEYLTRILLHALAKHD